MRHAFFLCCYTAEISCLSLSSTRQTKLTSWNPEGILRVTRINDRAMHMTWKLDSRSWSSDSICCLLSRMRILKERHTSLPISLSRSHIQLNVAQNIVEEHQSCRVQSYRIEVCKLVTCLFCCSHSAMPIDQANPTKPNHILVIGV
ncbi:hypothetical protein BDV06DRAFT_88031 [Aspergillus oleicola]